MDKIICEVCGTSYQNSSSQCPICGYAKSVRPKTAFDQDRTGNYQYVRGGRFSASNVKKRIENNESALVFEPQRTQPQNHRSKPAKKGVNFLLGIIAIVVLVALILSLSWFIVDIVADRFMKVELPDITESTPVNTEPSLAVDVSQITLQSPGMSQAIVPLMAVDQTLLSFVSADSTVATVDDNGVVTAVAPGNTVITVSFGKQSCEVAVICEFTETTAPSEAVFALNREDITFDTAGATWDLCGDSVTVPKTSIQWSSDDEQIATIESGVVKAVAPGETKVHGEYEGVKYSCIIRCKFEAEEPTDPTGEGGIVIKISHKDVTIAVDESFNLQLRDQNKNAFQVEWKVSEEGIVSIDGNKVTGVKGGSTVIVSTTYEGKTYKCTVRVKKP